MPVPAIRPQPLVRISELFDEPAWLWELKLDGFRALAYLEKRGCRLVSAQRAYYRTFPDLPSFQASFDNMNPMNDRPGSLLLREVIGTGEALSGVKTANLSCTFRCFSMLFA